MSETPYPYVYPPPPHSPRRLPGTPRSVLYTRRVRTGHPRRLRTSQSPSPDPGTWGETVNTLDTTYLLLSLHWVTPSVTPPTSWWVWDGVGRRSSPRDWVSGWRGGEEPRETRGLQRQVATKTEDVDSRHTLPGDGCGLWETDDNYNHSLYCLKETLLLPDDCDTIVLVRFVCRVSTLITLKKKTFAMSHGLFSEK